jgi:hypothetical protein
MTESTWSFDIPWRDPSPKEPRPPWCWAIVTLDDGTSIGGSVHGTSQGRDAIQYVVTIPSPDDLGVIVFVGHYRADTVRSIVHVDQGHALHHSYEDPGLLPSSVRSHLVGRGLLPQLVKASRKGQTA